MASGFLICKSRVFEFFFVSGEDRRGEQVPRLRVERVCDVAVVPVGGPAAGHGDEQPGFAADDLYVVHREAVVYDDRRDRFEQFVVLVDKPYLYVAQLDIFTPKKYLSILYNAPYVLATILRYIFEITANFCALWRSRI